MSSLSLQFANHYSFNVSASLLEPEEPQKQSKAYLNSFGVIEEEESVQPTGKLIKQENTDQLPINFFHSPGEYSKMLIKCRAPGGDSFGEKKIGGLKNLEFLNQPLFQRQREKKNNRIRDYCELERKKMTLTQHSTVSKVNPCSCCCCEEFCAECARTATCEAAGVTREENGGTKENYLIDIEAIKAGKTGMAGKMGKRRKKVIKSKSKNQYKSIEVPSEVYDPHLCCRKPSKNSIFNIDQLINDSLIKQVEKKRERELTRLTHQEKRYYKEEFNHVVRQTNRASSTSKSSKLLREPKSLQKSKKEIRNEYWDEIKDRVTLELRRQKVEKSLEFCHEVHKSESDISLKKGSRNHTIKEMDKLRIKYGKQALRQEKSHKESQLKLNKMKVKQLLALASEQDEIIKHNQKKQFRPSQSMLENAFRGLE